MRIDRVMGKIEIGQLPLSLMTYRKLRKLGISSLDEAFDARNSRRMKRLGLIAASELVKVAAPYVEALRTQGTWRKGPSVRLARGIRRRRPRGSRAGCPVKEEEVAPTYVPAADAADTILGRALTDEECELLRATPASDLGLSVRATNATRRLRCDTALDVALLPAEAVVRLKNCGRVTLGELRKASQRALATGRLDSAEASVDSNAVRKMVDEFLESLDERRRFVIRERFGLWGGTKETLEDLGYVLGVTRERIRQIEAKAIRSLRNSMLRRRGVALLVRLRETMLQQLAADAFCGVLRAEDFQELWNADVTPRSERELDEPGVRTIAAQFLKEVFAPDAAMNPERFISDGEGRYFCSAEVRNRFQLIEEWVRSLLIGKGRPLAIADAVAVLKSQGVEVAHQELERFAEVSSLFGVDWAGSLGLRRWNIFLRRDVGTLVQRALMELGEPTHYSHIADKVNAMFPNRGPFSLSGITGAMLRHPQTFVALGRGMYALRNWGISRPPFLKDFLAEAIRAAGGEAAAEELAELGGRRYGFKRTSVALTLAMNPQLFKHLGHQKYRLV